MKQKILKLLRAARTRYFTRCQQATETETWNKKPICLLAHREVNLENANLNFDHVNLVFLVNSNSISQLNAILGEDNNVCYTNTGSDE